MSDLTIDLNCDMGEGYGRWQMGQDELLVKYVSTVSVAAGYHAETRQPCEERWRPP